MIVHCVLVGHDFFHEVQVAAQVFFRAEKFVRLKEIPQHGLAVVGIVDNDECIGKLFDNNQELATHSMKIGELGVKKTLILAIFYALKEYTGLDVPWGALVGVRPSKQVRLWLESGDSEDEIFDRLNTIYKSREDKIILATRVARAEQAIIPHLKGVSLYVGVPFCPSRCAYCSFITAHTISNDETHSEYLSALSREMERMETAEIQNIYIGGGTPTALSPKNLERLLIMVEKLRGGLTTEYTVEAGRPDSLSEEKLRLLKDFGITRIAINPQTLNDETLRRIGRLHTAEDFFRAFAAARDVGFDNINVDIIAGLPGEMESDMERTLEGLKGLAPEHITVHTLAIKRAAALTMETEVAAFRVVDNMLKLAYSSCEEWGLLPYYMYRQKNMVGQFENVGFSRLGYECRYNVAMMAEVQTVLAVGAGGVMKVVEGSRIERRFNVKEVGVYLGRYNKNPCGRY
ncbi:MAG: coproporphyrinogen dehydrogenase HemZ [Turicibacter sp.]|nr:coproporphyrinogen dehydrogenase HemZ [Turicibacter sp.]